MPEELNQLKWTNEKIDLTDRKVSRHICVGNCKANNRSHFASSEGFQTLHWAVDKNGKLWHKGKCGGHDLLRINVAPQSETTEEEHLVGISEWTACDEQAPTYEARMEKFRIFHEKRMAEIRRRNEYRSARRAARRKRGWNAGRFQNHRKDSDDPSPSS